MPRKGQQLSDASISLMKNSKFLKEISQYNWEIAEPYLDISLSSSSKNKKNKLCTLREFKDFTEKGLSLSELRKIGYCKHELQFISNFLKGKIKLSKEDFEAKYLSGKSLDEISSVHCITREDMTFLRQLYDIDRKGSKYIQRKQNEVPLSDRQKEILYGSLMGDAKKVSSSAVGFCHGTSQKEYLLWKFKEFENVSSPKSVKSVNYFSSKGSSLVDTRFYTYANSDIEKIVNLFYFSGKKEISEEILNNLTPLSVAVWYMDDGTCDYHHRGNLNNMTIFTPVCIFCTESFSKQSCENIQKWFNNKFDIKVRLKDRKISTGVGYRIIIENESIEKFTELIKPYVLPMFMYKIDYKSYLQKNNADKEYVEFSDLVSCPTGEEFKCLDLKQQDMWVSKIVSYYHRRGFDYLLKNINRSHQDMYKVFHKPDSFLVHSDCIGFSSIGNIFLMSHFPEFWSAKSKARKSPKEIFESSSYLSEIIREILVDNNFPRKNIILRKLRYYRGSKSISGFMPLVARSVYDKYCNENSNILDFCGGYGGRMFGALASKKVKSYTCCEINFSSYVGLCELYKNIKLLSETDKNASICNQDSLVFMKSLSDKSFDLCFTSPPYFDAEEYSSKGEQSSIKYSSYGHWFEEYLWPCVKEAIRVSKTVIINIAKTGSYDIPFDLKNYLNKEGIAYNIDYLRMPMFGNKKFKKEPFFVINPQEK